MQYPSLQDIYDLSTQDLRKLQQQLRSDSTGHQQLLETVSLQIQERKTLEYFAQICQAQNPYAKKVAAFNEQFLKLAAEAIQKNHNQRMQGIKQYEPSYIPSQQQLQSQYKSQKSQYSQKSKNQNNFEKPVNTSHSYSSSSLQQRQNTDQTDTRSITSQQNSQSDAISTTTNTSINTKNNNTKTVTQKQQKAYVQVKMNIGAKKEGKGKTNDILARTLVQDDGIIKRNNHNSPHNNHNPYKKFHIPGQKHEQKQQQNNQGSSSQISQKSIKSSKQTNKQQQKSNKSIQSNQPKNQKQSQSHDSKSKKQSGAKNKSQKKQTGVKLPKIGQYQDLVQMVKIQEQKKKNKQKKQKNDDKLPHIDNHTQNAQIQDRIQQQKQQIEEQIQSVQSHINGENNNTKHQLKQGTRTVNYVKRPSTTQKPDDIIVQQQFEESCSPAKIEKTYDKVQNKQNMTENNSNKISNHDNIIQVKKLNKQQINTQKQDLSLKNSSKQQINEQMKHKNKNKAQSQIQITKNNQIIQLKQQTNKQSGVNGFIKKQETSHTQIDSKNISTSQNCKQMNEAIDYTKKLLQQIDSTQNQCSTIKINTKQQQKQNQLQQQQEQTAKLSEHNQNKQQQVKKCYSQQYWAHVRQQAELKIKRFKQQKQYQQKRQIQKKNSISSVDDNQKNQQQNQHQQKEITNAIMQKIKQQEAIFMKEMTNKNDQLNKLKKQMMKKTNKKIGQATPAPKPIFLRPKPQFDYLSVYPTFNHIFSVMYLKPQAQALADVPNLLRDLKTLFSSHLQHFANRSNFKPAVFLPFDHNGTFQLTDPKQLIAHAQQTYIDLRVMIERVEMFNQNLHGEFAPMQNQGEQKFYRVVKTKQEVYDIITTSFMRRKGWKQLPHGCSLRTSWNLFWSWSKPDVDLNKLLVWQKINHFPFNKNLSRKDLLYKNLDMFRKSFKISMPFLPLTFNLPKQFSQLSARFHEQQVINRDNNYWIMKPIGKSRGRGIKVVSSLSQLNYTDNIVVQKYILNPMLIDGYKFDMRIYVLVTSFHPLEAFVYKEGFARLSTQKYTLDSQSIKNTYVHLTNFAINKNNVATNTNFAGGSKISLKTLKDKVTRMGYSFSNIWTQVHEIIVKSLLGCSVSVPSFPTAFQLFGYDIMVDQQCNCHLIQINASPSLQRSYMIDQIVKQNLIDDIVDLVDPPQFDKKEMIEVFNERINNITNKKKITADEDLIGLARILKYKPIRKIGQIPSKMGLFEVVAPSQASKQLQGLIKARSGSNNPMNID